MRERCCVDVGDEIPDDAWQDDDRPSPSEIAFQREGGEQLPRDRDGRLICRRPSSWERGEAAA